MFQNYKIISLSLLIFLHSLASHAIELDEIEKEHLALVHVTSQLPTKSEDGPYTMIPGNATQTPSGHHIVSPDTVPQTRFTCHFTLNHTVQDHDWGTWEKTPYAFIAPFSALKERLVGGLVTDLFTLGPLALPENTVYVVPKGHAGALFGAHVREYDPDTTPLKVAVESILKEHDYGVLGPTTSTNGTFSLRDQTYPMSFSSPSFWGSFRPSFYRGEHCESPYFLLEELAGKFGLDIFCFLTTFNLDERPRDPLKYKQLYTYYAFLDARYKTDIEVYFEWQNLLFSDAPLSPESHTLLRKRQNQLRDLHALFEAEKRVWQDGKSLLLGENAFKIIADTGLTLEEKVRALQQGAVPFASHPAPLASNIRPQTIWRIKGDFLWAVTLYAYHDTPMPAHPEESITEQTSEDASEAAEQTISTSYLPATLADELLELMFHYLPEHACPHPLLNALNKFLRASGKNPKECLQQIPLHTLSPQPDLEASEYWTLYQAQQEKG